MEKLLTALSSSETDIFLLLHYMWIFWRHIQNFSVQLATCHTCRVNRRFGVFKLGSSNWGLLLIRHISVERRPNGNKEVKRPIGTKENFSMRFQNLLMRVNVASD